MQNLLTANPRTITIIPQLVVDPHLLITEYNIPMSQQALLMKHIVLKISGFTFKLPIKEDIGIHLNACVLNKYDFWMSIFCLALIGSNMRKLYWNIVNLNKKVCKEIIQQKQNLWNNKWKIYICSVNNYFITTNLPINLQKLSREQGNLQK